MPQLVSFRPLPKKLCALVAFLLLVAGVLPARAADPTPQATVPAAKPQSAAARPKEAVAPKDAAQDAAASQAPGTDQTSVVADLPLTEEALRARIERVKTAPGLGPGARARAISSYETALADLTTAGSLARKAAAFEQARAEAPEVLSNLGREAAHGETEPKISRQLSADELETMLQEFEGQLGAARTMLAKIEGEQNKRARRRLESPREEADASGQVAEIDTRLKISVQPRPDDDVAVAERAALMAKRELLLATLAFNEKEIETYDARRDLLAAKRDQAIRRVARLTESVRELRDLVGSAQRTEAERDVKKARQAARDVARLDPELHALAKRNAELAAMRSGPDGLATRIEEVRAIVADTGAKVDHIAQRYDRARDKAQAVGFTPAIGLLLRKERAELPDVAEQQRAMRERRSEIGGVQLKLIELEDERDDIADVDTTLKHVMAKVDTELDARGRRRVESTARELLLTQRGYLDSLIQDYDAYFTSLVELDAKERELVSAVDRYRNYIDENVLWIRGPSIASERMFDGLRGGIHWLVRTSNAGRLADGLSTTLSVRPLTTALAVLSWLVLFVYRRRMQALLADLCSTRAKALAMPFSDTLRALWLTAALAAIWPSFLALVAYLFAGVEGASGSFGSALGAGLHETALIFFFAAFLRRMCKAGGPGEIHLGWPAKATAAVRRPLTFAMAAGLPAMLLVTTLDNQANDLFKSSLGRVAFAAGMVVLAVATYRMVRSGSGLLDDAIRDTSTPWSAYLTRAFRFVAVAVPVVLAAMAVGGYDFAALSVAHRAAETACVALVLFLGHSVAMRWLVFARRKMALRQAWQAEAARQQVEQNAQGDGEGMPVAEPDAIDIGTVNLQTRRLIGTFLAVTFIIATWLFWHDVLPALRVFERVQLWTVTEQVTETVKTEGGEQQRTIIEQQPVTLADLMAAIVIALLSLVAARNIPGLLEVTLLHQFRFDTGLRYAVTSISRYVLVVLGTVLVASKLGVGWSKVQWLIAAVTVGLGFGLQEIFANFISGLIILFERPIRVGDVVTLGQVTGTVARIRIRATTIVDPDRKELIVPNKEFITGQLINWTLSDQILRVVVTVGVAYGTDTELVLEILMRIGLESEHVLRDPGPSATFSGFGENALDFELSVFVARFEHFGRTRHGLAMAIDKEFRKANIEIAFPQRDLHIRSVSAPIPVTVRSEAPTRDVGAQQSGLSAGRRA
jgi:potassium efflux system protein